MKPSRSGRRSRPSLHHARTRVLAMVAISAVGILAAGTTAGTALAAPLAPVRAAAPAARPLTPARAVALARRNGRPVPVPAATTSTQTLTADPDGALTVTQSLAPVRKLVRGSWVKLNATLSRGPGGKIVTAATTSALTLSAGGTAPLATLRSGNRSLAITMPVKLPAPVLSGATATYGSVLPGVDLQVTADVQGGFTEVLIVRNARAAADPALKSLTMGVRTAGLTVTAGTGGSLAARDQYGRTVFSAPAPVMWDSAAATPTAGPAAGRTALVTNPVTRQRLSAKTGLPVSSSTSGPAEKAHIAPVAVTPRAHALTLRPSRAMLTSAATVYPVYIDPAWVPSAGSKANGSTTVNTAFPAQSYWGKLPGGLLQVGDQDWTSPTFTARSFMNMPVPAQIHGATVLSAQLNITEEIAPSCTATQVNLWSTGSISKSTTWNAQPAWNSVLASQTVAHGYTGCNAAGVGFNVLSIMQTAASKSSQTQETFGLRAADETDKFGWKQFSNNPTMTITYDHGPNVPSDLHTSPATSCSGSSTAGDGSVSLYAEVSHPDSGAVLGATITLWKTSDTTKAAVAGSGTALPDNFSSGDIATFVASQSALEKAAAGAVTEFSWNVTVTDHVSGIKNQTSATCSFNFDPTRPGQPNIDPPASTQSASGPVYGTIGTAESFSVTPASSGTAPSGYSYQLNQGPPTTATATSGDLTISITPTRFTNTLTVTSLSAAGNIGEIAEFTFNSAPPATPQADGDLTGDGVPDLLIAGGQDSLPSGIWLASGLGTGQVNPATTDIGTLGNGTAGDNAPADFNGAQIITGFFNPSGTGLQDILAYYPTGINAGSGNILYGDGDGSIIQAQLSGNEQTFDQPLSDVDGNVPQQVVNAGNTSGLTSQGAVQPDLLGISSNYLTLYSSAAPGAYNNDASELGVDISATPSPDGTLDWDSWTVATAQLSSGTAMYLWNKSTGALYLWTALAFNAAGSDLSYTSYTIAASGWSTGTALTLEADGIAAGSAPGLWAVNAAGTATGYKPTLGTGTATLAAQPAQVLTATLGGGLFTPVSPVRVFDTRSGTGAPLGVGGSLSVQMSGVDGIPANATAVVLNVTAVNSTAASSYLTIYPDGQARPTTSNMNFTAGQTTAAVVTLPLLGDGKADFWNESGSTDVLADLQGYYAPGSQSRYVPTASARLLDTRNGTGVPSGKAAPIAGGGVLAVTVANVDGIPADATAVTLNVAAVNSTAKSYLTVYPDGATRPVTSNVDFAAGVTTANLVIVPVTDGKIDIYNEAGSADVLADLQGYYTADSAGSLYTGTASTRLLDTRNGTGAPATPVGPNGTLSLQVAGVHGIPANATAVAVNVTVVGPTANSYLTVYPNGQPQPVTSNIDFASGQTIANLVIVPVYNGKITFWNHVGSVDLVADLQGYYVS
jgi:hypothetical protein